MSGVIWVDADACPQEVKELLFRAARRREIAVTLVANTSMRVPPSPWIATLVVPNGMNMADREIAKRAQPGDLVITADIPLAAEIVRVGAVALDPRGELYTDDNIGERLALRDLLDTMRGAGQILGGPASLTNNHRQAFANQLDRWIAKRKTRPS